MANFISETFCIPNASDPPMRPVEDPPQTSYDEEFYHRAELLRPKRRRTKQHTWDYRVTHIPWDAINTTELIDLCLQVKDLKTNMERWRVAHRGLPKEVLIGLILETIDSKELLENPVHYGRQGLQTLIYENWRHIWSQISCNTCCWECPDAKVLECVLENYNNLPRDLK